MKRKKVIVAVLIAALILSCAACTKSVKTSVDENIESAYEDNSAVTDDATEWESTEEDTTETSVETAEETTQTKSQTTAANQKAVKNADILSKSGTGNSKSFTTTKVTTGTTVPAQVQQNLYQLYKTSYDKTNAVTSLDADYTVNTNINAPAGTFLCDTTGNFKVKLVGNSYNALITQKGDFLGKSYSASVYYDGNYEYLSESGEKVKYKADSSSVEDDASTPVVLFNLSEKEFDYAQSSQSNGNTTITLNPDADCTEKIIGRSTDMLSKNVTNSFSDTTIAITINSQGYISGYEIKFNETEKFNSDNTVIYMANDIKITYNHPGQPVVINAPSDLGSYQEIQNPHY